MTEGADASTAGGSARVESASPFLPPDSRTRPVVSVVMPTRNEEAAVAACIERAERGVEAAGVPAELVVSDSSTDRTPEIARERGAIVVSPDERGYGSAYRYALERVRGEYVVMGDGDCTYDFAEMPRLLEAARSTGADVVVGSRFLGEIRPGSMPPLHRYVGNPLLTELLNLLYGTDVTDAHSGYRVARRDALDRLELAADGMEFASEMLVEASRRGMDVREVPITYHPRRGDPELDSFRDGWRHVAFLLANASPSTLDDLPASIPATLRRPD